MSRKAIVAGISAGVLALVSACGGNKPPATSVPVAQAAMTAPPVPGHYLPESFLRHARGAGGDRSSFEVLFRLYGPDKSFFDKTWKLPDIEGTPG